MFKPRELDNLIDSLETEQRVTAQTGAIAVGGSILALAIMTAAILERTGHVELSTEIRQWANSIPSAVKDLITPSTSILNPANIVSRWGKQDAEIVQTAANQALQQSTARDLTDSGFSFTDAMPIPEVVDAEDLIAQGSEILSMPEPPSCKSLLDVIHAIEAFQTRLRNRAPSMVEPIRNGTGLMHIYNHSAFSSLEMIRLQLITLSNKVCGGRAPEGPEQFYGKIV